MKTKKLKKKLDFIFINQFLNTDKIFTFDFTNKSINNLIQNKHLNKNLINSINSLNTFLYKYPLYIKVNQNNCVSENFVLVKVNNFFFQNNQLFKQNFESIFSRLQQFFFYHLIFIFIMLNRKNC